MCKIENGILIGKEIPIHKTWTNVGALMLKKMRSRPDIVAQVSKTHELDVDRYNNSIEFVLTFDLPTVHRD